MPGIGNKWLQLKVNAQANDVDLELFAADGPTLDRILERRAVFASTFGQALDSPPVINVTVRETWSSIDIHAKGSAQSFHLSFHLPHSQRYLTVTESVRSAAEPHQLDGFLAAWSFNCTSSNREVFSQNLVPEEGDLIGQHCLRSPVVSVQSDSRAAALVFDVAHLSLNCGLPAVMNLLQDSSKTTLVVGRLQHETRGHIYYRQQPRPVRQLFLYMVYDILVSSSAAPGEALEWAGQHLWAKTAAARSQSLPPLPLSYPELAHEIYNSAFATHWRESTVNGRRVGSVAVNRSYTGDVWLCAWFNQMHSAYGYYHWGQKCHRPEWIERAIAVRDLILSAPSRKGLFPTVAIFPTDGSSPRWVGSHQQGGGPGILHLMDMSWTLYLTLVFARDLLPSAETVARARQYCTALLELQREDGGLPAFVTEDEHLPVTRVSHRELLADLKDAGGETYVTNMLKDGWGEERYTDSAEDSASLLLLAELAHALPAADAFRGKLLHGAKRIVAWLEHWVFPESHWLDMEVGFSCGPKPLGFFDERSQQWPQNTLVMNFAALGLLRLYELTRDSKHLALAKRALHRLQLYQQVWSPPFLSIDGFGGYGVQNSDAEWNDARQAVFAATHLQFYKVTGSQEQLQRAKAACRASFITTILPAMGAVYPSGWFRSESALTAENHGHGGWDENCVVSGFDWGAGTGLTCAAQLERCKQ